MINRVSYLLVVSMGLLGICAGCAINTGPIQERREYPDIQAGKQAVLLIRVTYEDANGKISAGYGPYGVNVGLGGFETGGEIEVLKRVKMDGPFFLSSESSREGWAYFIAVPGVYYLAFLGPRTTSGAFSYLGYLKSAQRWRIEIPEGSKLIYGGTVHLLCRKVKLLFDTTCHEARQIGVLKNEESLVAEVASKHLQELGPPRTLLLQPHRGGPIIIQKPK